ncbi:UNVERIFIED_CONTAM: hypothetical protein Slati_2764200 [Sesamum latifolium]|uniref:Uncharacterized protein n=1 Tax=Sesamum latifolium TaxID=2727402 RepID=A0AAW2VXA1_9LAMI
MENPSNPANKQKAVKTSGNTQALQVVTGMPHCDWRRIYSYCLGADTAASQGCSPYSRSTAA